MIFRVTIVLFLFLIIFTNHAIADTKEDASENARLVAQNRLDAFIAIASKDSSGSSGIIPGWDATCHQLKSASIGDYFIARWGGSPDAFSNVTPSTIFDQSTSYNYCFPIFIDDVLLGTLDVREDPVIGGFVISSRSGWYADIQRLVDLRKDFPANLGYEISTLGYGGHYIVIQHKETPIYFSPIDKIAARVQSLEIQPNNEYSLIPAETAVAAIKQSKPSPKQE